MLYKYYHSVLSVLLLLGCRLARCSLLVLTVVRPGFTVDEKIMIESQSQKKSGRLAVRGTVLKILEGWTVQ